MTQTLSPVQIRRTIECPSGPSAGNAHCVKMHNPDPEAAWDFFLMLIYQKVGESAQTTTFIPLESGGYRKLTSRVNSREVQRIDSLEKYEAESLNFGFVSLAKMEVRKFYQEVRQTLFVTRGTVRDFDADGHPVGEIAPLEDAIWPDLPGDGEISNLLRSLRPSSRESKPEPLVDLSVGLHFPTVEVTDGEFEVADGKVFLGRADTSLRVAPPDGLRIETSFQEGVPTLVTHDYFLVENGERRRLFGERCAQDVYREVVEVYKDKSDSGFFRSKQKLEVIRRELRIETFTWTDT